jgi:hypothetical protein
LCANITDDPGGKVKKNVITSKIVLCELKKEHELPQPQVMILNFTIPESCSIFEQC